ncbi:MAG: hypothetical protein JSV58_06265 [Candidatus Bathyarchaeota archaeon]|nr:MAG: hypothetical protein JSV58_06265 [Candidatus Bathyarchaeota archaeon]
MQTKLFHAALSGVVIALVLGFVFIPVVWRIMGEEPVFGSTVDNLAIIGILSSVAVIAVILLSFRWVGRT